MAPALGLPGLFAIATLFACESPIALEPGGSLILPASAASHQIELSAAPGELIEIRIEQSSVDVEAWLWTEAEPDGLVVDRALSPESTETLFLLGEGDRVTRARLDLRLDPLPGAEAIEVRAERRTATSRDRDFVAAWQAHARAGRLVATGTSGPEAAELLTGAAESFRILGETAYEAESLARLGDVYESWTASVEELPDGLDSLRASVAPRLEAFELYRSLGDTWQQADLLVYLGASHLELGDVDGALRYYRRALPLARESEDRLLEAYTLHGIGYGLQELGRHQQALDRFRQALDLLDADRDRADRAHTLHEIGALHLDLGMAERSLDYLSTAAEVFAELGWRWAEARSLTRIGEARLRIDDLEAARSAFRRSVDLRDPGEDRRGRAGSLRGLGLALERMGDDEAALIAYREGLEILEEEPTPLTEGPLRLQLGSVLSRRGDEAAGAELARARELFEETGRPLYLAQTLVEEALWLRRRASGRGGSGDHGDLEPAIGRGLRALDLVESQRPETIRLDLRRSLFESVQPLFEATIDLLMEAEAREPGVGHSERAFEVAERARARLLLDHLASLQELALDGEGELADAEVLARESRLLRSLEEARARQRALEAEDSGERVSVDREVRGLAEELAEIRAVSPARGDRELGRAEGLGEIQDRLLDSDTVLLELFLGESRSFAWLVTDQELLAATLPGRRSLEGLARTAHRLLALSQRRETEAALEQALCRLSESLLRPFVGRLAASRLVIVADGALHYLPFAALPIPREQGAGCGARRVLAEHELVTLPSASVGLRLLARAPSTAERWLAVVADPIYEPGDPRAPSPWPRGAGEGRIELARLEHSAREAERIAALVPEAGVALNGAEARKDRIVVGALQRTRIVHFATHATLDAERPELSGIELSRVDEDGRLSDSSLRAHEIDRLDLDSELVVLSACQTALGKEIRGEGLVGLTQGFFAAGARRVVVSLWPVVDWSAPILMESFYRRLFEERLAPAEALRAAQLELASHEETSAPVHWAGFVLQGGWWDLAR